MHRALNSSAESGRTQFLPAIEKKLLKPKKIAVWLAYPLRLASRGLPWSLRESDVFSEIAWRFRPSKTSAL